MKRKSFLDICLPVEGRMPFDLLIIAAVSVFSFFCPIATYTSGGRPYDFLGYYFLTGIDVMGGSVHIAPVPMLYFLVLLILTTVIDAVLYKRIRPKIGAAFMLFTGILQMAFAVLTNTQLRNILPGLRGINPGWGLTLTGLCGIVLIIRAAYTLYRLGSMTMLDFFVLPAGLYLLINNYFPMVGLYIAFKNVDYSVGILRSPWCGFDNFRYLFVTSDAWLITRNTLLYNFSFIFLSNLLGIFIGLFLANLISKRMQKIYQTLILLPQLISYVIVGYIVFGFLSNEAGLLTKVMERSGSMVNFYAERRWWPFFLPIVYNWKSIGYAAVIYLASISGIDRNLYEASTIDGAGRLQQITRITLPLIKPTIITLVLLQLGRVFYSDFGLFFQVPRNSGMLFNVTQTVDTYVYRMLMTNNRIGMASAASFYQSIIGFMLVIGANAIVRRTSRDHALF